MHLRELWCSSNCGKMFIFLLPKSLNPLLLISARLVTRFSSADLSHSACTFLASIFSSSPFFQLFLAKKKKNHHTKAEAMQTMQRLHLTQMRDRKDTYSCTASTVSWISCSLSNPSPTQDHSGSLIQAPCLIKDCFWSCPDLSSTVSHKHV